MSEKTGKIVNWILAGLIGFIFIGSAMSKFFGGDEAAEMAKGIGLTVTTLKMLGAVELISAVLFILPRTGVLGTLLLAAYMGGAMATHITHGQSVIAPMLIQAVLWVAAVIRFPELRNRLSGSR
jgi:hypothetical protein